MQAMTIKPILFSSEMVRAILEGRKTVTRRVIKFLRGWNPKFYRYFTRYILDGAVLYGSNNIPAAKTPYQPGDILWVRETWQTKRGGGYLYKADTIGSFDLFMTPDGRVVNDIPWRPSIHMPREAARIFLRVTGVRVERLRNITEEQAEAEGAPKAFEYDMLEDTVIVPDEGGYSYFGFQVVWNSTIKPADLPRYGWDANPWVWVIEFERCKKPEGWPV